MRDWRFGLLRELVPGALIKRVGVDRLTWRQVYAWCYAEKLRSDDQGILLSTDDDSRYIRVRCGVFNRTGALRSAIEWSASELDFDLFAHLNSDGQQII